MRPFCWPTLELLIKGPIITLMAGLFFFSKESMASPIQEDIQLAGLAVQYSLNGAQSFDQGVYGKVGSRSVYVVPVNRLAFRGRLYWTMVKVLSEKYGCFIVRKNRTRDRFRFACRDGRTVVMEQEIDRRVARFSGRQFDRFGAEIMIRPGEAGRRAFVSLMKRRRLMRVASVGPQ